MLVMLIIRSTYSKKEPFDGFF